MLQCACRNPLQEREYQWQICSLNLSDVVIDLTFERLFQHRLTSEQLARAQSVYRAFRPLFGFQVANVVHLSSQKGNVNEVLASLEKWSRLVRLAPDIDTAYRDSKMFFDSVYKEYFMTSTDTINGVWLEEVRYSNGQLGMVPHVVDDAPDPDQAWVN